MNRNGNGQTLTGSNSEQNYEKSLSQSGESNQEVELPRMESIGSNSDSSDSDKEDVIYKKPVGTYLSSISVNI